MWAGIRAATLVMVSVSLGAAGALPALAQTGTAPAADHPALLQSDEDQQGETQRDRGFDPFLSSSDSKPFDPPPFSRGISNSGREITGGDDFDFDSLAAPGQRGRRRTGSGAQGNR